MEDDRGAPKDGAGGPAPATSGDGGPEPTGGAPSQELTEDEIAWVAGGSTEPSEEEPWNPGNYPLATPLV